jgi:sialate O-acetylesterase
LPNYRDQKAEPADEAWSHIREAQRRACRTLPDTGLIVTIDIGEARDIHPKNKLDVGKRMAYWALNDVYAKNITASGPSFRSAVPSTSGVEMIVSFDDVGRGLKTRDGGNLPSLQSPEQTRSGTGRKHRSSGVTR